MADSSSVSFQDRNSFLRQKLNYFKRPFFKDSMRASVLALAKSVNKRKERKLAIIFTLSCQSAWSSQRKLGVASVSFCAEFLSSLLLFHSYQGEVIPLKRKQLGRTLYIRVARIPLPIGIFAELTGRANIDVGVSTCVNLFDSHTIIN